MHCYWRSMRGKPNSAAAIFHYLSKFTLAAFVLRLRHGFPLNKGIPGADKRPVSDFAPLRNHWMEREATFAHWSWTGCIKRLFFILKMTVQAFPQSICSLLVEWDSWAFVFDGNLISQALSVTFVYSPYWWQRKSHLKSNRGFWSIDHRLPLIYALFFRVNLIYERKSLSYRKS